MDVQLHFPDGTLSTEHQALVETPGMFIGMNHAEKVDSGFDLISPGFYREDASKSGIDFLERNGLWTAF